MECAAPRLLLILSLHIFIEINDLQLENTHLVVNAIYKLRCSKLQKSYLQTILETVDASIHHLLLYSIGSVHTFDTYKHLNIYDSICVFAEKKANANTIYISFYQRVQAIL